VRLRLAALAIAAAACIAAPAAAQVPGTFPPAGPAQAVRPDTGRARRDSAGVDTSKAGRGAGLPAKPSRSFATPDSVAEALIKLRGFRVTRYSADSVQFLPPEKQIRLTGNSLLERDNSTLQADTVGYDEHNCLLTAAGSPEMFDAQGVVVGHGMRYDACNHAGIVGKATTSFPEGSATWYLRGNMAMDNEENRTYAAGATITSCDDPDPHYHFEAHEIKFVSKNLMVARPALLYVADVPILWMPFIFQDMRHGRHSGMIPPQFGINDIVRNSPTYHRHISNFGWYWVLGDYADAQVTTDWYAQSFWDVNGRVRYRWLDRFLAGGVSYQELHEVGGATSDRFTWYHQQQFSQSSSLSAGIDYASSSRHLAQRRGPGARRRDHRQPRQLPTDLRLGLALPRRQPHAEPRQAAGHDVAPHGRLHAEPDRHRPERDLVALVQPDQRAAVPAVHRDLHLHRGRGFVRDPGELAPDHPLVLDALPDRPVDVEQLVLGERPGQRRAPDAAAPGPGR
jgi:hypothetical protein